ncbi:MAG: hypothetical protein Q9194_006516, partial [Teloschistes cf. exilis]
MPSQVRTTLDPSPHSSRLINAPGISYRHFPRSLNGSTIVQPSSTTSSSAGSFAEPSSRPTSNVRISSSVSISSIASSSTFSSSPIPSSSSSTSVNASAKPVTTSAPAIGLQRSHSSSFPITTGPTSPNNASIGVPHIYFGCTPDPLDPWHDARSCSCQSRLYTYYATQSTADTTFAVCHTKGEESYGLQYSAGCTLTTSPLLKTPWVAPDDCCGYCKIEVPTVRIVYWAPQTAAPNASYPAHNVTAPPHVKRGPATVVEDGFTFSILASASCIAMTQTYHTVGGVHVVTRAYDAEALSSVRCVNSIGIGKDQHSVIWEKMNYNDLYYPIPLSESYSRVDRCFTNRKDNDVWGDWMRKPFISLPKDVSEFDPAWTTCSGVAIGAMDPPRALIPAAGFEDSPASGPGPVTQSSPNIPKATPGKIVPDPITRPTSPPQKGSDRVSVLSPHAQVTVQPQQPYEDPELSTLIVLKDPPQGPPSKQPDPSPILKEPSKSPEAAAPQPQQPSPDLPEDDHPTNTNDDPTTGPTSSPQKGRVSPSVKSPHAQVTVQPEPYEDPEFSTLTMLKDPPQGPPSQQPDPSSIVKEPSKRPAAAAPQPQESSPDLPEVDHPTNTNDDPVDPIVALTEVGNEGSVAKESAGVPERNTSGDQGQLDSISNALFPTPSPGPIDDQLNIGDQKEEAPSGQQQVSKPSDEDKQGGEPSDNGQKPKQTSPEEQNSANTPGESNSGNESPVTDKKPEPAPHNDPMQKGDPPNNSGGHTSAKNSGPSGSGESASDTMNTNTEDMSSNESGRGNNSKGPTSPPNENPSIVGTGDSTIPQQQGNGKNRNDHPESGPTTFAFISNPPPPLAQGQTIARAPDGAAIVGTATIHPGEVQVVHGTPVSVASAAIVVGSSTFAFNKPPQQNADETAAPRAPAISQAAGGGLVIGTKTILPGQKDSVNGHEVSVGSSNVFIDSKSYSFPRITPPPTVPSHIDVAGLRIAQGPANALVVGGSTYSQGAVATISGHTLSVGSNSIVVDGTPRALPQSTTARSPLLIGDQPVRKDTVGHILVGGSTLSLSPNGETTIAGHTISLDTTSKHIIIVDHQTYALPATAGPVEIPAARPTGADGSAFLTAGESVSRDAAGDLIIGSSTLLPAGSAVT